MPSDATTTRSAMQRALARFVRVEDGTVTIFGTLVFVLMIGVGGVAVDVMRYETQRTHLQYTLDRAVLAAASLSQRVDPEQVVLNYLETSGLEGYRVRTRVEQDPLGETFRRVTAVAEIDSRSIFMGMFGVPIMTAPAASAAEERVDNLEISLVLDISGSMRFSNKLPDLRDAANAFLTTIFDNGQPERISINVVPYAGHVNPGPVLFDFMGGVRRHNANSCIEFDTPDFNSGDLPLGSFEQVPHFMNWPIDWNWMDWGWCPQDDMGVIVGSNNLTGLTTFIDNIELHDGTGTHIGMKYGLSLLNPTSRPLFEHLDDLNLIRDEFRSRPADWDDAETAKFIVLMTDGNITEQVRPAQWDHAENPTEELRDRPGAHSRNRTSRNENVSRFLDICAVARAQEVVVFTIAFDVETSDAAFGQMRDCASSMAHFYHVEGTGIADAFLSIANTINRLRLVQ